MYWLLALMTMSLLAMIAVGIYFEIRPLPKGVRVPSWVKGSVGLNVLIYFAGMAGLLALGLQEAFAQPEEIEVAIEVSTGLGLALIGIGLPTGLAAIGAGIAVASAAAASLALIAEKPEAFGRTLVYLGLAEGIAIYGLVVTILMLGRV
jgi:V/A-type H+-transporting ATPase subunit K